VDFLEIKKAIMGLSKNKAAGPDEITNEMLVMLSDIIIE